MNSAIRQTLVAAGCVLALAGTAAAQSGRLSGASCSAPPRINCPQANCPVDQVRADGNAVEPKTGRKFFLDYPCDLKPGEEVVFVLSLHGAGSIGNWQRHYFPVVDLKEKYRLIVATPSAATTEPQRRWVAEADDAFLQNCQPGAATVSRTTRRRFVTWLAACGFPPISLTNSNGYRVSGTS